MLALSLNGKVTVWRSDCWSCCRCRGSDGETPTSLPSTATHSSRTNVSRRSSWKQQTRGRCKSNMYKLATLASMSVRSALNPRWATSLHSMLSVSPHCVDCCLVQISSLAHFSVKGNGKLHPCRLQLNCDGTRWHTGGEVKGKQANGVGSQYSSHYLGTRCIQHY